MADNDASTNGEPVLQETLEFLNAMSSKRQFITFYSLFRKKIYSYFSHRLTGQPMLADDLPSTVFAKAFQKFDQYNDDFAFSTWVYTIARNVLTDHYRANKVVVAELEQAEETEDPDQDFFAVIDATFDRERLQQAMKSLPQTQSEAIYRRYFLQEDMAGIAKKLGKTEEATRQALSRGCRKLATLLQNDA